MRIRPFHVVVLAAALSFAPAIAQSPGADLEAAVGTVVRAYSHFTIFDDVNIAVSRERAVTLTGRVTMPFKRHDIGARVARIDGVREVVNHLEVLPVSRGDAELRVRTARAIYGHSAFWQYASMVNPPIHIIVEHGRIRLTGRVNNEVERMLAFTLAQLDGALGVTNALTIDRR